MERLKRFERLIHRVSGAQATVETPRCLRQHSGLSDCHICVKSCPVQSIDISGGVHVLNNCTGCGVCLTVCPVSAFDLSGAAAGQLLSQVASLLRENPSPFITCERSADAASANLILPCLARLDETLLLGGLALGAQTLYLTRGPCENCPYLEAMPRYRRMLGRIHTWDRVLPGSGGRIVEVDEGNGDERQRSKAVGPDRRAFFTWVRSEGVQLVASFLDDFSRGFQGRASKRGLSLPLRNRLLPRFFKRLGVEEGDVPYDPEAPFAELLLDEIKCNACEACVQVCPTGAIERGGGEETFRLTLNADRCVNCALCLDACIPNALTYRQGLSLSGVASGDHQILVEKVYRHCGRCEGRFLGDGEGESQDLCPTCHFLADTEASGVVPQERTGGTWEGETGTSSVDRE